MGRPTYCSGKVGKCTGLHPRKGGAAHRGNTAGRSAMGAEIRPCRAPASSPARGQRGSQPRGEQGPAWSSSMKKKSPARWGEKLPAAERRGEWGAPWAMASSPARAGGVDKGASTVERSALAELRAMGPRELPARHGPRPGRGRGRPKEGRRVGEAGRREEGAMAGWGRSTRRTRDGGRTDGGHGRLLLHVEEADALLFCRV
jgi:hypothetical protein